MANLRSYARLTFKTKNAGNFFLDSSVNSDILAVTTQKDLSSPMGSFTIVLGPRIARQLSLQKGTTLVPDVITQFDLVQIEFKTDETGYKTEMIGLISRASIRLVIGKDGKPERTVLITGFDFGKALVAFKIFFNPFVTSQSGQEFGGLFVFGKDHNIFSDKNPAGFIVKFLQYCFGNSVADFIYPLVFGPDGENKKLTDYVDFVSGISTEFVNHTFSDPFILLGIGAGQEVSVYDIVSAYADNPFHEVFVDLRRPNSNTTVATVENTHRINPLPSTPIETLDVDSVNSGETVSGTFQQPYVFTMRTTPFSQTNWTALNRHIFYQSDVLEADTGTSEDNIFNYYEVHCERENFILGNVQISNLVQATLSRVPIFDDESISKYGLRKFPANKTKYVEFVKNADKGNLNILKKQASLIRELFRWFSYGELFESGTMALKGRVGVGPEGLTMGSRLVEYSTVNNPTGKEFYIEGVMQQFVLGIPLKTIASVTRGHVPFQTIVQNGTSIPGRYNQVAQLETNLLIDQANNGVFFEDIPF